MNNMTITRSLFHCLGSTLSLSVVPVIATFAVGIKLFSFAPLLIKWNFPLSEIPGPGFVLLPLLGRFRPEGPELTREHLDAVSQEFGSVARVGLRHIVISDLGIIHQVLDERLEVLNPENDVVRVVATTDTYIRGYRVPKGTIMTLNHSALPKMKKF